MRCFYLRGQARSNAPGERYARNEPERLPSYRRFPRVSMKSPWRCLFDQYTCHAHTVSPSLRRGPRQRATDFLPARLPVAGGPRCVRPTSATHTNRITVCTRALDFRAPFPAPKCRRSRGGPGVFHDASTRRAVAVRSVRVLSPTRTRYGLRLERHVTLVACRPAISGRVDAVWACEDRDRRQRGAVTRHTWRRPMTLFLRSAHRAPTPLSEEAEDTLAGGLDRLDAS